MPSSKEKLTQIVAAEYPNAQEILVSFPEQWESIHKIRRQDKLLFVAALPGNRERPRPDQFHGLPPEINKQLNIYQMYRLFEPWPLPSVTVAWNDALGQGTVEGPGTLKVQLNSLGQAQAWKGPKIAVLWECYLNEPAKVRYGQDLIYPFWKAVEEHMRVNQIFTQPHEPTWGQGYTDFLNELGYGPDPRYPEWWSKQKPS
jgi:hypothetical protein